MIRNNLAVSYGRAFRNRFTGLLLLPMIAVAASCATQAPEDLTASTSKSAAIGNPPAPGHKPAPPPGPLTADAAHALNELEIKPEREPETIIGLDEASLRARLGEPHLIEEQPPGIRWQYGATDCTVQVFFFMEVETQKLRVLSYDVTGTGDVAQSEQQCLAALSSQAGVERS